MAAVIELKYFNAFTMKKIKAIAQVEPSEGLIISVSTSNLVAQDANAFGPLSKSECNVGQEVYFEYVDGFGVDRIFRGSVTSMEISGGQNLVGLDKPVPDWVAQPTSSPISFKAINDFTNIPAAYINDEDQDRSNDWLLEESRIRGGYNNKSVDFGPKAYLVEDDTKQSHRFSGLIHSGIFNSRTGFNATNQFSVCQDITRTVDPANGSIQKLYAEDTNLIIFQESKVSKSLIDKDAIYTAEGNPQVTATNKVIGQNVAFAGEFGISTDPESFAVNGYRKYFTDRDQNIVCRLSRDGITPVSNAGMTDFFRDRLPIAKTIRGGWDAHNKQYVVSLDLPDTFVAPGTIRGATDTIVDLYETVAYDESSKGWVSRYSYKPNSIFSLNNTYFSTYRGKLYKHHTANTSSNERGVYYGESNDSFVTFVANGIPNSVKNFQTINYEGDSDWVMDSFVTDADSALTITKPFFATTLEEMENNMMANNFKKRQNKYYGTLFNNSPKAAGEVVFGSLSSGVKGFYGEVTMRMDNKKAGSKEIFAVSTTFVPS